MNLTRKFMKHVFPTSISQYLNFFNQHPAYMFLFSFMDWHAGFWLPCTMPSFVQSLCKNKNKHVDLCPRVILNSHSDFCFFYSFLQCFHTLYISGTLYAKANIGGNFSVIDFATWRGWIGMLLDFYYTYLKTQIVEEAKKTLAHMKVIGLIYYIFPFWIMHR